MSIIALIFAAGKGSRLQPFTDTTPKPLVPVTSEETIIERHMRLLSPYVDRYIIVTNYLEDQIISHIGESFLTLPVSYSHQDNPKGGTGDCLRVGLHNQGISPEDQIFVTNADEVLSQDTYVRIGEMLLGKKDFLLGQQLSDHERLKQFGIIQLHADNTYAQIVEKPQTYVSDLVNIGMYSLSGRILEYIPTYKPEFLQDNQEEYIFIALNAYAEKHPLQVVRTTEWITVSNMQDMTYVQGFLTQNTDW